MYHFLHSDFTVVIIAQHHLQLVLLCQEKTRSKTASRYWGTFQRPWYMRQYSPGSIRPLFPCWLPSHQLKRIHSPQLRTVQTHLQEKNKRSLRCWRNCKSQMLQKLFPFQIFSFKPSYSASHYSWWNSKRSQEGRKQSHKRWLHKITWYPFWSHASMEKCRPI